jgi:hypothetical protein
MLFANSAQTNSLDHGQQQLPPHTRILAVV